MAPMGFSFRRRRGRRFARRVGRIARATTGIMLAKRVLLDKLTVPDITSADFDNPLVVPLITCIEAQDEELESNGSDIATIPLYSRLMSIKMHLILHAFSSQTVFRWMLWKSPDNDLNPNMTTNFHSSNDSITDREIRKFILAKGIIVSNSSSVVNKIPMFVSRSAWARATPMREGDRINFQVAKDAAGTTAQLSGFGTMYVRARG